MDHSKKNRKVVCFTPWFPGHNNPRYDVLFSKLTPVVQFYKVTFSRNVL